MESILGADAYTDHMDIEEFLQEHGIAFQRFDHPAVFTCEESQRLVPPMPSMHTKNLFLRDDKWKRFFLVSVGHDKNVDLKQLKKILGVQKLSFGSPERLQEMLGVTPGAVTLLGLIHDHDHRVEVIIDAALWEADALGCHPLVNTATLVIAKEDIEKFLAVTGHRAKIIEVPEREL